MVNVIELKQLGMRKSCPKTCYTWCFRHSRRWHKANLLPL